MIKVTIHAVELEQNEIFARKSEGIATKYIGTHRVTATVTKIVGNTVVWQIREQDFFFHHETSTSFEVWEVRVEGVFKND